MAKPQTPSLSLVSVDHHHGKCVLPWIFGTYQRFLSLTHSPKYKSNVIIIDQGVHKQGSFKVHSTEALVADR